MPGQSDPYFTVVVDNSASGAGSESRSGLDLVIVHGINEDQACPDFAKEGVTALTKRCTELVDQDEVFEGRVIRFTYQTPPLLDGTRLPAALDLYAQGLVKGLTDLQEKTVRPLCFLSHDLGGAIVKRALSTISTNDTDWSIRDSTLCLIWFGVPHQFVSKAQLQSQVTSLLAARSTTPRNFLRLCEKWTDEITHINDVYEARMLPALHGVMNVYSEHGEISDHSTASTNIVGLIWEDNIEVEEPHSELCVVRRGDPIHSRLRRRLRQCSNYSLRHPHVVSDAIVAQSVPTQMYWSRLHLKASIERLSRIKSLSEWLERSGPAVLHFRVVDAKWQHVAAETMYHRLRDFSQDSLRPTVLLYFRFDRYDRRRHSLTGMLITLLAQAMRQSRSGELWPGDWMQDVGSWTPQELQSLLNSVLGDICASSTRVVVLLGGLDFEVETERQFVADLLHGPKVHDRPYKVVLAAEGDIERLDLYGTWAEIRQSVLSETLELVLPDPFLERRLRSLFYDRPELQPWEADIFAALRCSSVNHLHQAHMLDDLACGASPDMVVQMSTRQVGSKPDDLPKLRCVRSSVDSPIHTWAKNALSWMLGSCRPLTRRETQIALGTFHESFRKEDDFDILGSLQAVFGPIFVQYQGEIRWTSDETRRSFQNESCQPETGWYRTSADAHQLIAITCATQLRLHHSEDGNDRATSELIAYISDFWPVHFDAAEGDLITTLGVPSCAGLIQLWARTYWDRSSPAQRPNRMFQSWLPIAASLGFDRLLLAASKDAKTPCGSVEDRRLALIEAARCGHRSTFAMLLPISEPYPSTLWSAVMEAAASGDHDTIETAVTYIVATRSDFQWPSRVLCRVAQFGYTDIVHTLLKHGAQPDISYDTIERTPLYFAARLGRAEIVRVLTAHSPAGPVPERILNAACSSGDSDTVLALFSNDGDVFDAFHYRGVEEALGRASRLGNHAVVQALLCRAPALAFHKLWRALLDSAANGYTFTSQRLLEPVKIQGDHYDDVIQWMFSKALDNSHIHICARLLSRSVDIPSVSQKYDCLRNAALGGDLPALQLLLEHGADVDHQSQQGVTALHAAAYEGRLEMAICLLERGAKVELQSESGRTALHYAAESGHLHVVEMLLDRGAAINPQTKSGWNPLLLASDSPKVTRLLLQRGADVDITNNGASALHLAAQNDRVDTMKELLPFQPDLELRTTTGWTSLAAAIYFDSLGTASLLLDTGADYNQRAPDRQAALHLAMWRVASGNKAALAILRKLLEFDCDVNAEYRDSRRPLHLIQRDTPVEPIERLLNRGAMPDARDDLGWSPLSSAAQCGNVKVAQLLIARKVDTAFASREVGSPLHAACTNGHLEVAILLLEAGVDVNVIDTFAGTPLMAALLGKESKLSAQRLANGEDVAKGEKIARYLVTSSYADINLQGGHNGCALNVASAWSSAEIVEWLLDLGADHGLVDEYGRNALLYAGFNSLTIVQLLVERGYDATFEDKLGRTVLHFASAGGVVDIVQHILDAGSLPVDITDADGWTPLHWAIRGRGLWEWEGDQDHRRAGQHAIIELLLQRGADPCLAAPGRESWTPRRMASYHGLEEGTTQLLEQNVQVQAQLREGPEEPRLAFRHNGRCDCCSLSLIGTRYHCKACEDFDFCYKCMQSTPRIHDTSHEFETLGPEFAEVLDVEDLVDKESDMSVASSADREQRTDGEPMSDDESDREIDEIEDRKTTS